MPAPDDRPQPATEDLFWELGEPLPPTEAAGGGRVHRDSLAAEDEAGHAWQTFFAEPIGEGYGGSEGSGDFEPYGGERWSWGRETLSPGGERGFRVYGELYGHAQEGHGHRRRPYYAGASNADDRLPRMGPYTGRGPRNYRRSDERIKEELFRRLTAESWLDASDIEIEVAEGEVSLRGAVDTRRSRRLAEEIAAAVPGVREVHNRIDSADRPRGRRSSDRGH